MEEAQIKQIIERQPLHVAQDQYLFNTSLLENIRLGRLNATDEEVVEAAKKAQCMEFLMDHGKLVATGRHQELIQSCPEYQKLWKAAQDSAEWKVHTAKEGK